MVLLLLAPSCVWLNLGAVSGWRHVAWLQGRIALGAAWTRAACWSRVLVQMASSDTTTEASPHKTPTKHQRSEANAWS
jgi:hypothetical protein